MCIYHHCLIPEHFVMPKMKPHPCPLAVIPHSSLSRALAIISLLSVSLDLPFLDVSCEQNHKIHDIWYLASFPEHQVLGVHPCCSLCLCFVPFHSCIIFPRVVLPALGRAAQSCWRSHQTPDGSRVISADEGKQAWENQSDIILESFEMTAEYNI